LEISLRKYAINLGDYGALNYATSKLKIYTVINEKRKR
jgi:hypothetical protein